jgi:hypothetical protein
MTTIALVGAHRAGKSTLAALLAERHGFAVVEHSDVLWDVLAGIDPWVNAPGWCPDPVSSQWARLGDLESLYGRVEPKNRWPEVRRLLDEAGRHFRKTFGAESIHQAVVARSAMHPKVVWPGTRFPYEAEAATTVVAVFRPGCDEYYAPESEQALERSADFHILNDGPVEDVANAAVWLLEAVEKRRRAHVQALVNAGLPKMEVR